MRAHRCSAAPKAEFVVYFALIFLSRLPFAAWPGWLSRAPRPLPRTGRVARAWTEAQRITPLIFRADAMARSTEIRFGPSNGAAERRGGIARP